MLAETSRGIALLADIREGFVLLAEIPKGFALLGIAGRFARAVARSVRNGASLSRFSMHSVSLAAKAGFEVDA